MRVLVSVLTAGILGMVAVAAQPHPGRILMFSAGDNIEIDSVTLGDGSTPFPLNSNAPGLTVLLPDDGYTLGALEGSAQVVGQTSGSSTGVASAAGAGFGGAVAGAAIGAAAADTVSEAAVVEGGAANGLPAEGPTDWIRLETSVATLYYFSPDGSAEEGPPFRVESPSLWIRRLSNGRILLWFGQPGTTPPAVP